MLAELCGTFCNGSIRLIWQELAVFLDFSDKLSGTRAPGGRQMHRQRNAGDGRRRAQQPRERRQVPHALPGLFQHRSPAWNRLDKPEPDVRQGRLGQDERRDQQRRLHRKEAAGGGKQVG